MTKKRQRERSQEKQWKYKRNRKDGRKGRDKGVERRRKRLTGSRMKVESSRGEMVGSDFRKCVALLSHSAQLLPNTDTSSITAKPPRTSHPSLSLSLSARFSCSVVGNAITVTAFAKAEALTRNCKD